jgi:rubrerythrin
VISWRTLIEAARKESEETTAFLFMEILKDEKDHHDTFTTLREQIYKASSKNTPRVIPLFFNLQTSSPF